MMKIAAVFLAVIVAVLGACEKPKAIANFDRAQYAGIWRKHVVAGHLIYPVLPCLSLDFSRGARYSIKVTYKDSSGKIQSSISKELSSSGGVLKLNGGGKNLTYTVLDTDYKTYGSIYVCDEAAGNGNIEIHLRSTHANPQLLNEKLAAAQKLLSNPLSPQTNFDFSKC